MKAVIGHRGNSFTCNVRGRFGRSWSNPADIPSFARPRKSVPIPRKYDPKERDKYHVRFKALIKKAGVLDLFTPEYRFHKTRKWRIDWAVVPLKIAIELQRRDFFSIGDLQPPAVGRPVTYAPAQERNGDDGARRRAPQSWGGLS